MQAQSFWPGSGLEQLLDPEYLWAQLRAAEAWLVDELFVTSMVVQLLIIGLAFLAARYLAPRLRAWFEHQSRRRKLHDRLQAGAKALAPLTLPVCWLTLQWLSVLIAANAGWPHHLIKTVVSLLTAWVIIRLSSSLVRDPVWSKAVAMTAWTSAALNILGLLQPTVALLDAIKFLRDAIGSNSQLNSIMPPGTNYKWRCVTRSYTDRRLHYVDGRMKRYKVVTRRNYSTSQVISQWNRMNANALHCLTWVIKEVGNLNNYELSVYRNYIRGKNSRIQMAWDSNYLFIRYQ